MGCFASTNRLMNASQVEAFKGDGEICLSTLSSKCPAVSRLSFAYDLYITSTSQAEESQDTKTDPDQTDKFIAFMNARYPTFLDDIAHIIRIHGEELQKLQTLFPPCDIDKCTIISRHHRNDNKKNQSKPTDPILYFFTQAMDSMHVYFLHTFDCGLRTNIATYEEDEQNQIAYFDARFSRVLDAIDDKQKMLDAFPRFSSKNSKFIVPTDIDSKHFKYNKTTFLEYLMTSWMEIGVGDADVQRFYQFILNEQYDTDSVQEDVSGAFTGNSNISKFIHNNQIFALLIQCLKVLNATENQFAIGFRYYYWDHYKNIEDDEAEAEDWNGNDHSGHQIRELFIEKKYHSFKEEIANYTHFSLKQYNEIVVVKVRQYFASDFVKSLRAAAAACRVLHYNIKEESPITMEHLTSLILYTDWSDLCAQFSATFRKMERDEQLKSLKERNREFWWMSKLLRELVEIYGYCREGEYLHDDNEATLQLSGPFYCGMSQMMNVPEFSIRLCAPTSTSVHLAVGHRFSKGYGMVMQLNNPNTPQHRMLRGFDCSLISQFKEEGERLFIGGFYAIKIESVRLSSTRQNFELIFKALYNFDLMVTGGKKLSSLKVSKHHVKIIEELFNYKLTHSQTNILDPYVYSTFDTYVNHRKQITLDLQQLFRAKESNKYISKMVSVFMNKMEKREHKDDSAREDHDWTNLPQRNLFRIFKNVKSITINTTDSWRGTTSYSLSLMCLLSCIESASLRVATLKALNCGKSKYNWLGELDATLNATSNIKQKYDKQHYSLSINKVNRLKIKGRDECWCVINKRMHM